MENSSRPRRGAGFGRDYPIALAQQQQIQIIKDTAEAICNTVKEAKGEKSDIQIEGDVKAQLGGLLGKVANVGGSSKGSLSREEFEGLSRDATAAALEGDWGCRERVFNKMFDKLNTSSDGASPGKKSAIPMAEKLIVALDLGYNSMATVDQAENDPLKNRVAAALNRGHKVDCDNCLNKANVDARLLHLEPFSDVLASDIFEHFRRQITEIDLSEAFEIGEDIYTLGVDQDLFSRDLFNNLDADHFDRVRKELTLHLRSLNLSEVENQIPNKSFGVFEPSEGSAWVANFKASLNGVIRKNYPTVSVSE